MIDDDVVRIARNRARIEIRRQDQELQDAIRRVKANAAAAGVAGSSIPLLRIASLCADAATERGDIVWRVLHRTVAAAGIRYEPWLESELKSVAEEFLSPHLQELRQVPREAAQSQGITPIIPQLEGIVADGQRAGRELAWNEIELFVASLRAAEAHVAAGPASTAPRVMLNVYAPVGAIQAGDHATALVAPGVDLALRRQLAAALEALERRLPGAEGLAPEERDAAIDRVREARIEAQRPQPDRSRLAALLLMVSEAVRAVAELRPAMDALKAIAESLGMRLPW